MLATASQPTACSYSLVFRLPYGAQVPPNVAAAHGKAAKLLDLRRPYEEAVGGERPADAELLAAYMAYAKAEEAHGDPARVQVPLAC